MYPEIKIKEKKNSYVCKVKVSKEDMTDYATVEGMAEFKKDFLQSISDELDSFITQLVNDEDGYEAAIQVEEVLETIQITQIEKEVEEEETEEETEEIDEAKKDFELHGN
jgi:hypothetical protein